VSVGSFDLFLAKFSPTGAHLWSRSFGNTGLDIGYSVATDAFGNIVMAGAFQGTVDFGKGALTSAGLRDIIVAKYSGTGTPLWTQRFGGTSDDYAYGVSVGSAGNVAAVGVFQGAASFGGIALSSVGGSADAYVVQLAP
jgi:hypothetical protein